MCILCQKEPNVRGLACFLGLDTEEGRQQSFDLCTLLISVLEVIAQMLGYSLIFQKWKHSRLWHCPIESVSAGAICKLKIPSYKH